MTSTMASSATKAPTMVISTYSQGPARITVNTQTTTAGIVGETDDFTNKSTSITFRGSGLNESDSPETKTVGIPNVAVTNQDDSLVPLEVGIGVSVGVIVVCIVLIMLFVLIIRTSCKRKAKPLADPDNFESYRLMRSSANLLAISERNGPAAGRARARAGSLQLSHPPDTSALQDFQLSVKEACKKINGLEKQLGCLPEYLSLVEGPGGAYLELTVEYEIKPEVEEYIPYEVRFEQQMKLKNEKKGRRA